MKQGIIWLKKQRKMNWWVRSRKGFVRLKIVYLTLNHFLLILVDIPIGLLSPVGGLKSSAITAGIKKNK